MKDIMKFSQNAGVEKGTTGAPQSGVGNSFSPRGEFHVEHWRAGELLAVYNFKNGITNEGKNAIFDIMFDADTQITVWNMLLIDNLNYGALAATDTYDDIDQVANDWEEYKDYTDAGNSDSTVTRPVWSPDAASAQSISNSSQTIFDMTATGTVKGLAIVGGGAASNTKGNHASDGTLWATALFDQGDTAVVNSDQLKITYTVSA
jgi:hypothetical protein